MDDQDLEFVLLHVREVRIYQIPPATSAQGHKADDWKSCIWRGRCQVAGKGKDLLIKMIDNSSGELFAQCTIPQGDHEKYVERTIDSSRCFVLKITNGARHAFIGLGFEDRNDAFDFNCTVNDFKATWVDRKPVAASDEDAEAARAKQPSKDFSLKQGQKIQISFKGIVKNKQEDGAVVSPASRPAAANLDGSNGLAPPPGGLAPPPGGRRQRGGRANAAAAAAEETDSSNFGVVATPAPAAENVGYSASATSAAPAAAMQPNPAESFGFGAPSVPTAPSSAGSQAAASIPTSPAPVMTQAAPTDNFGLGTSSVPVASATTTAPGATANGFGFGFGAPGAQAASTNGFSADVSSPPGFCGVSPVLASLHATSKPWSYTSGSDDFDIFK